MKIIGISGSLRKDSFNTRLLHEVSNLIEVDYEIIPKAYLDVELFNEDEEQNQSIAVDQWRELLITADAVIISTPEYNGSIPGGLKNALDWASRSDNGLQGSALYGKPVLVLSASEGSYGAVWAAEELQKSLKTQGARVVKEKFSLPKADKQLDAGLTSQQKRQLKEVIETLISQTEKLQAALANKTLQKN